MTKKNVYIAFVISVFLGIGGAYLREFLDSTLKEASDIKNYTKFPFVGDISRINKQFYSKESGSIENDNSLLMAAEDLQKIAFLNYYFSKNKQTKTVIVTSSVPKEGKTFVSGNLGIFFAKKNETTIIVDADMRKGMLAKRFKVNSNKGLSDVILGKISLEEAIIPTSIPGLFLLCSGPYMSNPTEMLASLQLENILEKLKNKYEKIIIDSTPVLTVSESLILGPKTDGLVFIIQAHTTSIQHVHESYRILKDKVKIIGAILNKVNIKKAFIARNYFTN
jgi:receptor protein-tyrosine kinase